MDLYKGQNLIEFAERFKSDADCMEYLAQYKMVRGIYLFKMRTQSLSNKEESLQGLQ